MFSPSLLWAQSNPGVITSGAVTPGHVATFINPWSIQDGGALPSGTITLGTSASATNPQRSGFANTGLYYSGTGSGVGDGKEVDFSSAGTAGAGIGYESSYGFGYLMLAAGGGPQPWYVETCNGGANLCFADTYGIRFSVQTHDSNGSPPDSFLFRNAANGTGALVWTSNLTYSGATSGLSELSAGVISVDTTAVGNSSGSMKMTNLTATGSITNSGITADTGLTDATVCEDTTNHKFWSGSGTLGICLGTSSLRYKTNVVNITDGLEEIEALHPINFYYKKGYGDNGIHEQYGFLAEDVVKVLPKLTALDKDGKPNSVDILGMVPITIKAIQEQQEEIKALSPGAFPFHKCFFNLLVCPN